MLINITGSSSLGIHEVNEACNLVRDASNCDDLQINFGVITNDSMGDSVKVTVIATGFYTPEPAKEEPFFMPVAEAVAVHVVSQVEEQPEPVFIDPDDLDVPAYLRNSNKQIM